MTRNILLQKTIDNLPKLSTETLKEVFNFTEFLANKNRDRLIIEGIQKLTEDSESFSFLKEDEELYTKADLKEIYK